jgi:ABC-type multidrug transport system ATPase subunit
LLNTIAHRVSSRKLEVTGQISTSGVSAYVLQQDILLAELTVRETLRYAADLRLSNVPSSTERNAIVESVILELGLKDCASTRIGSSMRKGCSGGEKRRVSIGVQMLSNPSVLFCDEPTTGMSLLSTPKANNTNFRQDLTLTVPPR